jgi:hypothetical protein
VLYRGGDGVRVFPKQKTGPLAAVEARQQVEPDIKGSLLLYTLD